MIEELRELRDLLDGIEREAVDLDQGAIDAAISIVESLIVANEKPLPTPDVGLCYRVPTPFSPASAPPPPKAKRPENQHFEINSRKKRKRA